MGAVSASSKVPNRGQRHTGPSESGGGSSTASSWEPTAIPRNWTQGAHRDGDASRGGDAMQRLKSLLVGLGALAVGVSVWSLGVATAQQAPQYPLDDKLANEPAPWTVPGKWGKRGNWGRWGENDKRGMLNYITPDMIMKAAGLVKQGKVYALGEELHADVPRVITPQRMGIQIMQDRDGYDRAGTPDPKRYQVGASFTFMHNHTGSHLDAFAHRCRVDAHLQNK